MIDIDFKQLGLKGLSGIIVIGCLLTYLLGAIYSVEVLNNNCNYEINTDGVDLNAGYKSFMDVCIGIGLSPFVLFLLYLLCKALCEGNKMVMSFIMILLVCCTSIGMSFSEDTSARFSMIGLLSGVAITALACGVRQPDTAKGFVIRLCALGTILFSGGIAIASIGILKYNECFAYCSENDTCFRAAINEQVMTGEVDGADQTPQITLSSKLWGINGFSIGMLCLCIILLGCSKFF